MAQRFEHVVERRKKTDNPQMESAAPKLENLTLLQRLHQLEQENQELRLQLQTANEHSELLTEELAQSKQRMMQEISERDLAEQQLRQLQHTIEQDREDQELMVQAITEHSDELDQHWQGVVAAAENEALTDGLTRIANRRHFDRRLAHECQRAVRQRFPLGLAMIDVDHFKLYNDHTSHTDGDACLRRVADTLSSSCRRATDFVARYGGEEFAVIMSGSTLEQAETSIERLLQAIRARSITHPASPTAPYITLSVGLSWAETGSGVTPEQLLSHADQLLYAAKHSGRDQMCFGHFEVKRDDD